MQERSELSNFKPRSTHTNVATGLAVMGPYSAQIFISIWKTVFVLCWWRVADVSQFYWLWLHPPLLQDWKKEGTIDKKRKQLIVNDLEALEKEAKYTQNLPNAPLLDIQPQNKS